MDSTTKKIIRDTGCVPEFGLFGVDFLETQRMVRRLLKQHGLRLHVKNRREDDQSWVWLERVDTEREKERRK